MASQSGLGLGSAVTCGAIHQSEAEQYLPSQLTCEDL